MLTVISLTVREMARRRVLLVTAVLAAGFLALYGAAVYYGYKDIAAHAGRMPQAVRALIVPQFLALGLYFGSFIVAFLAVMGTVGTISSEIESGIMQSIATRPVRRAEIFLGKFFGYGFMLTAFSVLMYISVVIIVRTGTGAAIPIRPGALGLFCLQPVILLAVAMCGTTFLPTLANGVASFMLYTIGVVGGMVEQVGYLLRSGVMVKIGIVSSLLMPADSVYRKIVYDLIASTGLSPVSNIIGPFGSGAAPSVWMLAYTGIYILAFLALGLRVFSRRDI